MRILFVLTLALATVFAICGCNSPRTSTAPVPQVGEAQEVVRIALHGMSCPIRCPQDIQHQLSAVPGVVSVVVDYPDKSASCVVWAGTVPASLVEALRAPYSGELLN